MCKWFKHDVLAHRDKKLRALQAKHGHNGTGIYFHLLEVMGYDDDGYLDYDLDALCIELGLVKRKDRQVLDEVIKDFGLFEFTDDGSQFYSPRFTEYLDGINSASAASNAMETSPAIEPSSNTKRRYTLSDEGREKLKQTASNARKAKEQILESNPRNLGGTIGGETKELRDKTKDNREGEQKATKRFSPPTPEEVRAYCNDKGYPDESEPFVDHYESKGWLVGRSPMKDWRAALRNWMRRDFRQAPTNQDPRGERLNRSDDSMAKVRDSRW